MTIATDFALLSADASAITRQFKLCMDRDYPHLSDPSRYVLRNHGNRHAAVDDWHGDVASCAEEAIAECEGLGEEFVAATDAPEVFGELLDYITSELSLDPPSLDPYRED